MPFIHFRRFAYYSVVFVVAIVAHTEIPSTLIGQGVGDLLRRNSEAYVLMLVPLYWDLFAPCADPRSGTQPCRGVGNRPRSLQALWFGVLIVATMLIQPRMQASADTGSARAFVTLGEAYLAALVVTVYLGWTRGFFAPSRHYPSGQAVVSARSRVAYYAVVVVVAVLGEQSWLGASVADYIRLNTEATAAMILIPAYFDLVAVPGRRAVRIGWYGGLLALPLVVQLALGSSVIGQPVFSWLETVTEAVLAAVVVSGYFDWVRGTLVHDRISAAELG